MEKMEAQREPTEGGKIVQLEPTPHPLETEARCTDLANARRLVEVASRGNPDCCPIRYVWLWGEWLCWDGRRWAPDTGGTMLRHAREVVFELYDDAAQAANREQEKMLARHATTSGSRKRIDAMIYLAASEEGIAAQPDGLDTDRMKLNVENGTLDLDTGERKPHRPADYITRMAAVLHDPAARDETLDMYLEHLTAGDADLLGYLQRAAGLTLTGRMDEEVFFLILGPPQTGKSTLVEAMLAMLGDYAAKASFATFLEKRSIGGPQPDVLALRGVRMVAAVEAAERQHLAAPFIKEWVGGDQVTARGCFHRHMTTFRPEAKLWLASNHAPRIRDRDAAMWRRTRRVPFESVVPEKNPEVKRHLIESPQARSALLNWCLNGLAAWRRHGLGSCEAVTSKTAELRAEMDPCREFFESSCVLNVKCETPSIILRAAYEKWAQEYGARPVSNREWGDRLKDLGCQNVRKTIDGCKATLWSGIGLLA